MRKIRTHGILWLLNGWNPSQRLKKSLSLYSANRISKKNAVNENFIDFSNAFQRENKIFQFPDLFKFSDIIINTCYQKITLSPEHTSNHPLIHYNYRTKLFSHPDPEKLVRKYSVIPNET